MVFMKGESYWAVPCLTGAKKKIVTVTGRRGKRVTFAKPVPMEVTWNGEFDGREIARLQGEDGEYTVSAASRVDLQEALEVMAVIKPEGFKPRAARHFFCGGNGDAKI